MRFELAALSFETPAAPAPQDEGNGKSLSGLLLGGGQIGQNAHDVALFHDQEILAVEHDLGAGPLAEQHAVSDLEIDRDQLAGFVTAARTNGGDFALGGLFLGGVRNDDAALGLFFGFDALDHNAVVKRTEFHAILPGFCNYFWIGSRSERVLAALHISL